MSSLIELLANEPPVGSPTTQTAVEDIAALAAAESEADVAAVQQRSRHAVELMMSPMVCDVMGSVDAKFSQSSSTGTPMADFVKPVRALCSGSVGAHVAQWSDEHPTFANNGSIVGSMGGSATSPRVRNLHSLERTATTNTADVSTSESIHDERAVSQMRSRLHHAYHYACRQSHIQLPESLVKQYAKHSISEVPFTIDDAIQQLRAELAELPHLTVVNHCAELHLLIINLITANARPTEQVHLQAMKSMASLVAQTPVTTTHQVSKHFESDGTKSINGYVILDELGRGAAGKVKLAYDTKNNRMVAIKIVRRVDIVPKIGGTTTAQSQFQSLQREIAVMKKLRHKNIVSLFEVIDDPGANKLYIVMQYVDDGPLTHHLSDGDAMTYVPVPPAQLQKYARNIFAGLMYLHSRGIIHRDIKLENVLVSKDKVAYLADFGVSEVLGLKGHHKRRSQAVEGRKGTLLYMSPELLKGTHVVNGRSVDIWACGVLLYTALTGKLPYRNAEEILAAKHPPVMPEEYDAEWSYLIDGLMAIDPAERLTAMHAHAIVKQMCHKCAGGEKNGRLPELAQQDQTLEVGEEEIDSAFTAISRVSQTNSMLQEGRFSLNDDQDDGENREEEEESPAQQQRSDSGSSASVPWMRATSPPTPAGVDKRDSNTSTKTRNSEPEVTVLVANPSGVLTSQETNEDEFPQHLEPHPPLTTPPAKPGAAGDHQNLQLGPRSGSHTLSQEGSSHVRAKIESIVAHRQEEANSAVKA